MSRYGFSVEFQDSILRLMASDRTFLLQYRKAIDPAYFTEQEDVDAATAILAVFDATGAMPSLGSALEAAAETPTDPDEAQDRLRCVYNDGLPADATYIRDKVVQFGQQQRLREVMLRGQEFLDSGDFTGYEAAVRDAILVSSDEAANVCDFDADLVGLLHEARGAAADVIPCNVPVLAERIPDGGIGIGEMGIIMGLPQRGKTELLVNLGIGALAAGKRVLHVSVGDMTQRKVVARYSAAVTAQTKAECRLNPEATEARVVQFMESTGGRGRLRIKYWPAKRVTVADLERYIRWMEVRHDWRPDLLVVDYGQKMKAERKYGAEGTRHEHEEIYEHLRALGGTVGAGVWSAQQANRGQFSNDHPPGMGEAAEAFGPMRDADIVIGVAGKKIDDHHVRLMLRGAKVRDSETATDWIESALVNIATHQILPWDPNGAYNQQDDDDEDDDAPPQRRVPPKRSA